MRRLMLSTLLAVALVGCGSDDSESGQGGWVRVTNAASHGLGLVRWDAFYVSHDEAMNPVEDSDLDVGETGHVQLDPGLTVWGEPHYLQFFVDTTEYRTGEEYTVARGQTTEIVIDDSTQVIECLLDTDPHCNPVIP